MGINARWFKSSIRADGSWHIPIGTLQCCAYNIIWLVGLVGVRSRSWKLSEFSTLETWWKEPLVVLFDLSCIAVSTAIKSPCKNPRHQQNPANIIYIYIHNRYTYNIYNIIYIYTYNIIYILLYSIFGCCLPQFFGVCGVDHFAGSLRIRLCMQTQVAGFAQPLRGQVGLVGLGHCQGSSSPSRGNKNWTKLGAFQKYPKPKA